MRSLARTAVKWVRDIGQGGVFQMSFTVVHGERATVQTPAGPDVVYVQNAERNPVFSPPLRVGPQGGAATLTLSQFRQRLENLTEADLNLSPPAQGSNH